MATGRGTHLPVAVPPHGEQDAYWLCRLLAGSPAWRTALAALLLLGSRYTVWAVRLDLARRSLLPFARRRDIELVVAYYCEGAEWFRDWDIPTTVYVKGGRKCWPHVEGMPTRRAHKHRKTMVELPNLGREGHSYLYHIVQYYDTLATYTVFAQGKGEHNGVDVRTSVDEFLASKIPAMVYPIVRYSKGKPIMFRDNEKNESVGFKEDLRTYVIPTYDDYGVADLVCSAYAGLFGGSECDAPPAVFGAGAMFIVHRDAIRSKPLSFWQYLERITQECGIYGYHLERIWTFVFDPETRPAREPQDPPQCRTNGRAVYRLPELNCSNLTRQREPWHMPMLNDTR